MDMDIQAIQAALEADRQRRMQEGLRRLDALVTELRSELRCDIEAVPMIEDGKIVARIGVKAL